MELLHEVVLEGILVEMFPYEGDDYPNHYEALYSYEDDIYHVLFSPGTPDEQPAPLKILSSFSEDNPDLVELGDQAYLEDLDRWERDLLARLDIKDDQEPEYDNSPYADEELSDWDATLEDGLDDTFYDFEEEEE